MKDTENQISGNTMWIYENLYVLLHRVNLPQSIDFYFMKCFEENGWRNAMKIMKKMYIGDRALEKSLNGKKIGFEANQEYCQKRAIALEDFHKKFKFTKAIEADFDSSLFITYLVMIERVLSIGDIFGRGSLIHATAYDRYAEQDKKADLMIGKLFDVSSYDVNYFDLVKPDFTTLGNRFHLGE